MQFSRRLKIEDSSNVEFLLYDPVNNKLVVTFHSGRYMYNNVPPAVFGAACSAESIGKYISESVKNKYDFTQLKDGEKV